MPYDELRGDKMFDTDEEARKNALTVLRKLGGVIGRILFHRKRHIFDEQTGELIGVEYQTSRGKVVRWIIATGSHLSSEEQALGISLSHDIKPEGGPAIHIASKQRRRIRN